MGQSVSLSELIADAATIPVTLAGRTFDVTYAPSNISGQLMQDVARVDESAGMERIAILSRIVCEMVTDWELRENEPRNVPAEDRPKVALTMERLNGVSAFVLMAVMQAVFEHIRMGKVNGTRPNFAMPLASPAKSRRLGASRTHTH